jgi:hypothetical protein
MNEELRNKILGMAEFPGITDEQKAALIDGWERYFRRMLITGDAAQASEFHDIMRVRVKFGSISLVAPEIGEKG